MKLSRISRKVLGIILSIFFLVVDDGYAQKSKEEGYQKRVDAEAYFDRGNTFFDQGKYDEAIADYTKVIELNPADPEVYYSRANAFYYKRDFEKSFDDLRRLEALGYHVEPNPRLLNELDNASDRERYLKELKRYSAREK